MGRYTLNWGFRASPSEISGERLRVGSILPCNIIVIIILYYIKRGPATAQARLRIVPE